MAGFLSLDLREVLEKGKYLLKIEYLPQDFRVQVANSEIWSNREKTGVDGVEAMGLNKSEGIFKRFK